jgi:hypothetical protein
MITVHFQSPPKCDCLIPEMLTLNFKLSTLYPPPFTLNPQPSTRNPQPSTLNPQPSTLNPQPSTLNPQPSTLDPPPEILNYVTPQGNRGMSLAPRHALRLIIPHRGIISTEAGSSSTLLPSAARLASVQALRCLTTERNVTLKPAAVASHLPSSASSAPHGQSAAVAFSCDETLSDSDISVVTFLAIDANAGPNTLNPNC